MHELFSDNAWPFLGPVIMFISIAVISVGCTIAVQWRKARQVEVETSLKREMVERGMSAEEIVMVLGASSKPANEAQSVAQLAEQGMSADDIVKIIKASSNREERAGSV
jgi:hypothetical protein